MTHWAGQYVPQPAWPTVCGPVGTATLRVTDAEGKDCNVFHGDYTGLAVDSADRVHVIWTGREQLEPGEARRLHSAAGQATPHGCSAGVDGQEFLHSMRGAASNGQVK